MVKAVSRLTVAQVIGKYKAGRHAELRDLMEYRRCRTVAVHCDAPGEINLDGELLMARDARFEVVPHAVRFLYPQGLRFRSTVAQPVSAAR